MKKYLLPLFAMILLAGCQSDNTSREKPEGNVFRTNAPSRLYFKNMRTTRYRQEQEGGSRIDLYIPRGLPFDKPDRIFYPVIADNWLEDEAYFWIRFGDYRENNTSIRLKFKKGDQQRELTLVDNSPEAHLLLAGQIDQAIASETQISIETQKGYIPLFKEDKEKTLFRMSLRDFKKLVEKQ